MSAFATPHYYLLQHPNSKLQLCHRGRKLVATTPRKRVSIRCSFAESSDPATPDAVRALLTSEGKAEQQRGLLLVRQLPSPIALELLLLSVETSKNEFIRSTATIGIGQLDLSDPRICNEAVQALIHLLATDAEYSVRAAAAASIGYITPPQPEILVSLLEALERALLEDSEWQVHFSCLASFGGLQDKKSIPTLIKWLKSRNDLLVQAAVGAIGDIGDITAIPELLKLLGNEDMMTRQRLAQSLGSMTQSKNEPAVIDALRTLSKDQSFAVRDAAVEALRSFGCANPVKADFQTDEEKIDMEVANLLEGNETGNAGIVASDALRRRLERSFDKEYVQEKSDTKPYETSLGEVMKDTDESTIQTNEKDNQSIDTIQDMKLFEKLASTLKYGELSDRVMAAIRLRQFDSKLVLNAVISSQAYDPKVGSERLRSVCVNLLARGGARDLTIRILQTDPDQNVRSACCDALMDLGANEDTIRAGLKAFQSDDHWLVRVSAAIALGTIGKGSSQVENILITSLEPGGMAGLEPPQDGVVRRHVITALGFLGSVRALDVFATLLSSEETDSALRYRIAAAIRGIHCDRSVKIAKSLARDTDPEVSDMAQGTLDALLQHGYS